MAAEIALATRLDKSSQFMKKGLALLAEDKHLPRQTTELAGAAATTVSLDIRHANVGGGCLNIVWSIQRATRWHKRSGLSKALTKN